MANIDIEAFKREGFSLEDIESIKRWLDDIEEGRVYTEKEFYTRLEKRLFPKKSKAYV